ncbi:hypothetical protein AOC40_13865 [Listeria monocytogenes]|nr:hypothetical protein [Listeria monocytogenes]
MESDILGVFQCGTSQERKGKKDSLFNGKKGASLKHLSWHSPKKDQNKVIKCMVIICRANYWKFKVKIKSKNAWRFPIISSVAL